MSRKIDLFKDGWELIGKFDVGDLDSYAHEWDFSDDYLKELGPKVCPVCGAPVDVDDGVVHCTECDWELV